MSVNSSMPDSGNQSVEKSHIPANGNKEPLDSEDGSSIEDADFNWDEYLEETGASAAPHTSFKHVEISLQSSFQPGMKLEVANKSNPDTYWVATIITTCGQLLLLRYFGYGDDRKADFWCDVMTAELHPVGWCTLNNKVLMPPDAAVGAIVFQQLQRSHVSKTSAIAIKEKCTDWTEFLINDLTGSRTAPANLLEGPLRGKNSVDLVTAGCVMELQDARDPFRYWPVSVTENVGGRLRLRYVGLKEADAYDQWLFYLDCRLRPVGWCEENNYKMEPPSDICCLRNTSEWKCSLEKSLHDAAQCPLPVEAFKDHADLRSHSFMTGMKLEAVDPREPFDICPASVTNVFNNHYFQVTIDDLRAEPCTSSFLCHADSLGILPIQWCLINGVNLTSPKGYSGLDFDWADYQKQCGAEAAPHVCFRNTSNSRGFAKNMKLEAVNPRDPAELCVASVTKVKGRLMWLHLEGLQKPVPEYIVDVESMDIFPVGWCEANGYPLTPPQKAVLQQTRKIAVVQPEKQLPSSVPVEKIPQEPYNVPQADPIGSPNGKYCCPQLFINHRCFSGPYLNKGRIAELPQAVGPGKCVLVLKEVLAMMINAAYKPGRVLRELQFVEDPQWNFQEETLKAKYKGKTYRATVKIVKTSDQVGDFCRRVCAKLECCSNLFSPVQVTETCSENCSVHTKTKYTYYYGKRKKIIKSPTGDGNGESGLIKPGRRRKKRKSIFVQKKRRSSTIEFAPIESAEESDCEDLEGMEVESGSEGTSSELREDQTDTSSADVPPMRPRRTVTLQSSRESLRHPATKKDMRERRTQAFPHIEREKQNSNKSEPKAEEEERLVLESNPLEWTVTDVVRFIKATDCASLAKIFHEQDIDGQALLLLTLPTVQECMELKLGPAIKLCHQIERVKVAFYAQFAK